VTPADAARTELDAIASEIGAVLWPGLSHVLASARLELDTLVGRLRRDRSGVLRDEAELATQGALAARTKHAGWCLGVLAAAQGVDLLRGRHETEGLRWMVGALAEQSALRLTPPAVELPRIESRACKAWEVSLLATWCVMHAAQSSDGVVRWRTGERNATKWLAFEARAAQMERERCARLSSAEPKSLRLDASPGQLELSWP
jgi:hypothetical protein